MTALSKYLRRNIVALSIRQRPSIYFSALVALSCPAFGQEVIQAANSSALTSAIAAIDDGGIIELTGSFYSSPTDGFLLDDAARSFTVRAADGVSPVLDGGGSREVMRINNSAPIILEGLTFRNGLSTTFNTRSGGVTVKNSSATFIDCRFEDNVTNPSTSGGGGVRMTEDSEAFFIDCVWDGNSSRNFGGAMTVFESTAWVHRGQVTGNRTNIPGHKTTAVGGGFTVSAGDTGASVPAKLTVTNSRFVANEAAFAGGALYANALWVDPVSTPRSLLVVANSTFEDNLAQPDSAGSTPSPPGGGAINVEDQSTTRVYNSRFLDNRAEIAGGINVYRSIVEVYDSIFRGNQATGVEQGGFGGAISATSSDTGGDGATNRRSASVAVSQSLLQGRFGTVQETGQVGGCVFTSGDTPRQYGLGITQIQNLPFNRATVSLSGVALYDCDAEDLRPGGGIGGGISVSLVDLDVDSSLIAESDATVQGGGLRPSSQSLVTVTDSFLAKNSATLSGGAINANASTVTITDSSLVENDAPSGAAMRSDPNTNLFGQGLEINMAGTVSGSVISNNSGGLDIGEVDFNDGPINDVRYNANTFFDAGNVYSNAVAGAHTVSSLNSLNIVRSGAANTNKSQVANSNAAQAPVTGTILAVPPAIIPVTAAGDTATSTQSFLAYAWSGASATLDGGPVSGNSGLVGSGAGTHTLDVGAQSFTADIVAAPAPNAAFTASPANLPEGGGTTTLTWNLTAGTFLDMALDQRLSPSVATASGSVQVSPTVTTTYRLLMVTEQGGVVKEVTVGVGNTLIFTDGFESGNTAQWSNTVP